MLNSIDGTVGAVKDIPPSMTISESDEGKVDVPPIKIEKYNQVDIRLDGED